MRVQSSACAVAILGFALPAVAQTCAVKNHMRLVNRVNGGTEPEIRIDTGWQAIAPGTSLVTPGSAFDSSPLGTSQGSWVATSAYGSLAFSGSGSGNNSPGNGIFLWIDEWIGGEPKAQFRDRLTVVSASLPANTPVTIRAVANVNGYATCTAPPPSAEQSFSATFGGPAGLNMTFSNAPGQQTQDFVVPVGQFRDFFGRIYCTIRDYRIAGGAVFTDTIQADVFATLSLTVLTPGASLTFCSDAAYAPCTGDLNSDGFVDDADFVIFVNAYNILDCADPVMPAGCPADFNADGFVDDADFVLFVAAYNELICP